MRKYITNSLEPAAWYLSSVGHPPLPSPQQHTSAQMLTFLTKKIKTCVVLQPWEQPRAPGVTLKVSDPLVRREPGLPLPLPGQDQRRDVPPARGYN